MKNAFLIAAIVALTHSTTFAVDIVTRRSDGSDIKGTITSATTSAIVVKSAAGNETTIPITDVRRVRFDKEPTALNSARANERAGAFETALEKYKEIQSTYNNSDKRLVSDLKFLVARTTARIATTDASRLPEALKLLDEFRVADKNNFRYLEATLLHANLLGMNDQVDQGKALLEEVRQSSVKGYQLQAGVALGRLMLQSGDVSGALQAFEGVSKQSEGDESSSGAFYEAMLGRATCLQRQGGTDQAIQVLDQIIDQASETETATLAEAWLRKGDNLKTKGQIKAALMAFLHVDVLYPGEPAPHAEALYQLSQVWGPAGYPERAAEASAQLTSKYPNSPWAQKK